MAVTLPSPLLDEKQAAKLLGTSPGVLQVWRCNRRVQIPYVKIGRSVRYKPEDLTNFIASRTVGASAE